MSDPYIGEIRPWPGAFAPVGWLFCQGQDLQISEYDTLFALIGTTYGGDGQTTFGLPDLQGRVPVHRSPTYFIGQMGGVESLTLAPQQMPVHTHTAIGSTDPATSSGAQNAVPASLSAAGTTYAYGTLAPYGTIHASTIAPAGGSQPHDNMQPYLAIGFIIATEGIYPPQS